MREKIQKRLQATPFLPFTVVMSNGKEYTVRHPENALLTKLFLIVYDPVTEEDDELYLLHVASLHKKQEA